MANIKVFTSKDKHMIKGLSDVHVMTKNQLQAGFGLSERRIRDMQKDKLIEQKTYYNTETKTHDKCYCLTDGGRQAAREKCDVDYFYKSNSAAHDVRLADRYLELEQDDRNRWITETEQQDRFGSMGASACDGGYTTTTGELVLVEVVTQSYSKEQREMKQEYAQSVGASRYEELRN